MLKYFEVMQDGRVKYERGGRKHESKGHYARTIHKQVKEKIVFLKYKISKVLVMYTYS